MLAKDRQAADCHGHAHVWLVRDDLELLLEKFPERLGAPDPTPLFLLPLYSLLTTHNYSTLSKCSLLTFTDLRQL